MTCSKSWTTTRKGAPVSSAIAADFSVGRIITRKKAWGDDQKWWRCYHCGNEHHFARDCPRAHLESSAAKAAETGDPWTSWKTKKSEPAAETPSTPVQAMPPVDEAMPPAMSAVPDAAPESGKKRRERERWEARRLHRAQWRENAEYRLSQAELGRSWDDVNVRYRPWGGVCRKESRG